MRLLYLYIAGWGIFSERYPVSLNFTSNYRFRVEERNGKLHLICHKSKNPLPRNFFSADGESTTVDEVSLLAGENGSGKTSIAVALQRMRMQTIDGTCDIPFIMVVENHEGWHCFSTFENFEFPKGQTPKDDCIYIPTNHYKQDPISNQLNNLFHLVYYSPFITTENPFDLYNSPSTINLSSLALMDNRPGRYLNKTIGPNDSTNGLVRLYAFEQYEWILRFLFWYKSCQERNGDATKIDLHLPYSVLILPQNNMIAISEAVILEFAQGTRSGFVPDADQKFISSFYSEVITVFRWIKSRANDLFTRALLAFYGNYFRNAHLPNRDIQKCCDTFGIALHIGLKKLRETFVPGQDFRKAVLAVLDEASKENKSPVIAENKISSVYKFFSAMPRTAIGNGAFRIKLSSLEQAEKSGLFSLFDLHAQSKPQNDFVAFQFDPPLASGEISLLNLFSRLYWYITKEAVKTNEITRNIVLFLDEAETALHPRWQRELVHNILLLLNAVGKEYGYKFHVIFSSHSPILLSDVPIDNCIFLRRFDNGDEHYSATVDVADNSVGFTNTFAANIFDLYNLSFFLDKGATGRFASEKTRQLLTAVRELAISKLQTKLQTETDASPEGIDEDLLCIAKLIGDKFIQAYLREWLPQISDDN